jgi:serine/threonine protein kinase
MDTESSFNSNGYDYQIQPETIEGEFCNVYFGQRSAEGSEGGPLENICLKVPRSAAHNGKMRNESRILSSLNHKSLPTYLGTIELEGGKKANVLRKIEDSYNLVQLRDEFPNGFFERHTVWVMERLLSVLGYLHSNNTIHGSISPANIMITPGNHNGLLIDYLLAIPDANQPGARYAGTNEFSAPEIAAGALPHPASDMYSLGKSIVYLLDGNIGAYPSGIDTRISNFIDGLLKENPSRRKDDAWAAFHDLAYLRRQIFGDTNHFLELRVGGN